MAGTYLAFLSERFERLETIFWVKIVKLFFDPGSVIRYGKIRIRDKHPGSATLKKGTGSLEVG